MARTFASASSEVITLAIGALNAAFGPATVAVIAKTASDGAVKYAVNLGTANVSNVALGLTAGDVIAISIANAVKSGTATLKTADGWALLAASKATGTATPRLHLYKYGANSWTHEAAGATAANVTPTTAAHFGARIGSTSFWNGDIAVAGVWGVVLADQDVESLAYSLPPWLANSPRALWILDQQAVTQAIPDLSGGGANQSARTGTAVSANSVPVWTPYAVEAVV